METFKNLIREFRENKEVERIIDSENKVETFEEIRSEYELELNDFKNELGELYDEEISAKNSVQICIICMMSGKNDYEVFWEYEKLSRALHQVTGKLQKVAKELEKFLLTGGEFVSDCGKTELIERFFGR